MLGVVELINKTFLETRIYGLTSHAHLLLLSKDDRKSDLFVVIIATGLKEFHIEYLLPEDKRPWTDARVKGATKSIEEFKKYIVIAMSESLGWRDSSELIELYRSTKK
jgi:hypothetical protein